MSITDEITKDIVVALMNNTQDVHSNSIEEVAGKLASAYKTIYEAVVAPDK